MFWDSILGWLSVDMGIDLGTCNTLVCIKGEGIVLNEPSVVAVYKGTSTVLKNGNAVGLDAKEMLGKTPENIEAIRPMKEGVISDFKVTEAMLRYFIRRATGKRRFVPPRVVIAVPSGISPVERRAVIDSAMRAGARRVFLLKEPMAAAIGSGLPVLEPTASMIVDIGGGTTEVGLISLGGLSASNSVRVAGDDFDEAISNHMTRVYNMAIGELMAERIKVSIGSAAPFPSDNEPAMEVSGKDRLSGLPRRTTVTAGEIREALQEPVNSIVKAVTTTLEAVPAELAAELVDNGITMAGGSSLLRGLTTVLSNATGLDVRLSDDPLTCVARGTSVYLDNLDVWAETLDHEQNDL